MQQDNMKKVLTVFGINIYSDGKQYSMREHYQTGNNWYSIPLVLGKNGKEVYESLNNELGINDMFWHSKSQEEAKQIHAFVEDIKNLPDLS